MGDTKNQDLLKNAILSPKAINPEDQKTLNEPLKTPSGASDANRAFFKDLLGKLEKGQINLLSPSSLLNQSIYDKLPENIQGKIDLDSVNLLSKCREIKSLYDLGQTDSYQMDYMVESVRLIKERIEAEAGDVFII